MKDKRLSHIDEKYHVLFHDEFIEVWWPKGWNSVIYDALDKLLVLHNDGHTIELQQIKEKFGGLRMYTDSYEDKDVRQICVEAEGLSLNTCQRCGADNVSVKIRPIPQSSAIIASLCRPCGRGPEIENTGSSGV